MKKSFRVLLLLIISLFTLLNVVSAAKPTGSNTTSINVTSTSSYKSISLNYQLVNSKKAADRYIIYRGTQKIYDGVKTSFSDNGLHSDTEYYYTVEARLNGRLLAKATYNTFTKAIIINPIEITATVQSDDSVVLTWPNLNSGLAPDQYKVFVNGTLNTTLTPSASSTQNTTLPDLQPGDHFIKIEGWYQDELVSQSSKMVSIPEPIVAKPILVTSTVHADFSADIYFPTPSDLHIDDYKIFINNDEVLNGSITQANYHISELSPSQIYSVRVEAYSEGKMVGLGNTEFISPNLITVENDTLDFESRVMQVNFSYDDSLQPADRMVITRKKVTLVNRMPTEDTVSEVVYDGLPIDMYTESQFSLDVAGYNYEVVNYRNDSVVGSGKGFVPNFFDY
ncbi:fibronectin type III domain-containing protein [Neobacillus niacini]|uniref:fibronectin type III domain-containing protein n=1 Tax=Neobacillus niacini TaxID=86668 RepID=UPI002FFEB7D3